MKRLSRIMLVAAFAAAFMLTCSPLAIAKTYKLTYSNFFPPTHIQSKLGESRCQEVEKITGGKGDGVENTCRIQGFSQHG